MTPELEKRLSKRTIPFDWKTFFLAEEIKLTDLRRLLLVICDLLIINDYTELNICNDWWEHDGFQIDAKKIDPKIYKEYFDDTTSLYNAADEDFAVRIGVYPNNFDWYLRFNIDEEYGGATDKELGDFDLTLCSKYENSNIIDCLRAISILEDIMAVDFFNKSYGG